MGYHTSGLSQMKRVEFKLVDLLDISLKKLLE